jgi:hypothetical protein
MRPDTSLPDAPLGAYRAAFLTGQAALIAELHAQAGGARWDVALNRSSVATARSNRHEKPRRLPALRGRPYLASRAGDPGWVLAHRLTTLRRARGGDSSWRRTLSKVPWTRKPPW